MPLIINKYIRKLWLYARKKPIYYLSTTHILCNFLAKSVVQRIFWRHADFTMHLTVFEFQFRRDSWNTSGNNETQKWSWDLSSYWRSGWKETKALLPWRVAAQTWIPRGRGTISTICDIGYYVLLVLLLWLLSLLLVGG